MAKDKKAKAAAKKARTNEKQTKKTAKKEKKNKTKGKDADSDDDGDVDLDAVLAEYAKQQEQFLKVTETVCEPPRARSSATILANPSNENEIFLFGGEYYNGALARFFNDLFAYNSKSDEWKLITSPNTPLPRSGHAWTRGGNTNTIYLFGGEFSSPKQGTFYHYNDFWTLEPRSREWTRIESKGKASSPPARSGHRMCYFKQYILLFGGFQDTSITTKYLNDLWIYDTQSFQWFNPALPTATSKPDPRSSFSFLPHDKGAVLYGGYSRVKTNTSAGKQQQKSGGGGPTKTWLKPVVHQDTWFLRITPPGTDSSPSTPPKVVWERRRRPANPPNPARAGATMAYHKGRGIQFGGVHDEEASEEGIESEFFNNLFAWNVERNRYFPLSLRKPRAAKDGGKKSEVQKGRRGRGKADEEELLRNLAKLEIKGKISSGNDGGDGDSDIEDMLAQNSDDDDEDKKVSKPISFEFPYPRFNAQLTVSGDILYIYGGTFEKGDREFTFEEMFSIDLGKLDGVKEIFRREIEDWIGDEEEEEEEDEDEDGEEEDDESGSESDAEKDGEEPSTAATSLTGETAAETAQKNKEEAEAEETAPQSSLQDDGLPYPRPFESLREFYNRASLEWQNLVIDDLNRKGSMADHGADAYTVKEIKKFAFGKSEERWWECREEVRAAEDEQEEAGIGEVVSIADRGGGTGNGVGKRR